ncbi:nucleotidyltransferase [Bacillus cereus group sp. BfR-BA-01363]|uniref:nucleotide-binding domain-containing protein n=1 Tax=Bacillus cereus group sp. BfR-BA-01363 TaxID=3094882 RepID=UPI0029C5EC14|nr:nucleotidyltransferase [Bacillus cereus group sp. BfR-BA-01363]MDX5853453.1 nucleotidyltransferase [Bacillus cereus group sp. BfR-BA-01363]
MYDLNNKLMKFYKDHVVLSRKDKSRLFRFKNLNLDRLKDGLKEYNEEHKTNYAVEDTVVQGSVSMSTVVQNERKDYDIDVAIIFDKHNLPEGTTATKKMVANALEKKCTQFKEPPTAKTNCVRIVYEEGYHIDFAIYRRYRDEYGEYQYEHCGSEWRPRNPRSITKWFINENKAKNYNLRIVARLLKMFCKSRLKWEMPGGLVQSVLLNECFQAKTRIDEMFYHTLVAVRNRLTIDKEVNNPTDAEQSLKLIQKDDVRLERLKNRLTTYLGKLEVLFEKGCTPEQAIKAWHEFFNHGYWEEQLEQEKETNSAVSKSYASTDIKLYNESEEFIEYMFPVNIQYNLSLECRVTQDGFRPYFLNDWLSRGLHLPISKQLDFYIKDNCVTKPYHVYWKVKNRGDVAKEKNCVRGQIIKTNSETLKECTSFNGEHFVECYIVKQGVCVATAKIDVPIEA